MLQVNRVTKGQLYKRIYRRMTLKWSFSYIPFVNFHVRKKMSGSHNMTVLYLNLCYNEVCSRRTALYS